MNELDGYQETICSSAAYKIKTVSKRGFIQLNTGGGKTVIFSTMTHRFITKCDKDVLILVNRTELFKGTRETLYNWYNIVSSPIDARPENKTTQPGRVYVAMVQTINNRLKNPAFRKMLNNVGMIICDEAHLSDFKKIFKYFEKQDYIRLGFSATPIAATTKDPLINYYDWIVVGPSTAELIAINQLNPKRGLVQNMTYCVDTGLDRSNLKIGSNGEFDEAYMGAELSKPKFIQECVNGYIKFGYGKKAFVYNADISHSKKVCRAFRDAGFPSRHLDGETVPQGPHVDAVGVLQAADYEWLPNGWKSGYEKWREDCFDWLEKTPGAILNNVGIATTGTDVPSIEVIVVNSSMIGVTLWLQKCGRGARPYIRSDGSIKDIFTIIDLGGNAKPNVHGDWSDYRDWEDIFLNPKKPGSGVAPCKECPVCEGIRPASERICKGKVRDELFGLIPCGFVFPVKDKTFDDVPAEFVLITKGIDVKKMLTFFSNKADYNGFLHIVETIAEFAKSEIKEAVIYDHQFNQIKAQLWVKVKEWCKRVGKRNIEWYEQTSENKLKDELKKRGFIYEKQFSLED